MSDVGPRSAEDRILVTGSGGVLGTALLRELSDQPHVTGLRRADCDLLDFNATLSFWQDLRPTVVHHLAGWVAGVQGNLNNAGRAYYENAQINLNVIEASRRVGVRKIVAAGTTAIYSDDVTLPMREQDLWVGVPHGSEGAYGYAKRGMLVQLEAYRLQYGIDYAFMICTNLYGENDRFDERFGHVVPSLVSRFERAVREGAETITIWGDGSPTRDFLYSGDAARAFRRAAEVGSGPFNTATGEAITIRQLVELLTRAFEYKGRVVWDTSKPSGQKRRAYDVANLRALDWAPQVPLEAGLARTAAWYKAHRDDARR